VPPVTVAGPTTTLPPDVATMMLAPADLPAGWTPATDVSGPLAPDKTQPAECGTTLAALSAKRFAGSSVSFQQSEFGPFLFEGVGMFPTAKDAGAAVLQLQQSTKRCQTYTSTDARGRTTTNTLSAVTLKKIGDQSFAVALTTTGGDFPGTAAYYVVRKGRRLLVLSPATIGTPLTLDAPTLLTKAFAKLP
jgi:hypothetical protein